MTCTCVRIFGNSMPSQSVTDILCLAPTILSFVQMNASSFCCLTRDLAFDKFLYSKRTVIRLFCYLRMPYELKNCSATFQHAMNQFACSIPNVHLYAYLDDIIIISPTHEQHMQALATVFRQLQKFNLRVNRKKCRFVAYDLSIWVTTSHPMESRPIRAKLRQFKFVQSFVLTCFWYRKFLSDFAEIATKEKQNIQMDRYLKVDN